MNKFLLAQNVHQDSGRNIYILQTNADRKLIEIIPYKNIEDVDVEYRDIVDFFVYKNPNGESENMMLKVKDFYDIPNFSAWVYHEQEALTSIIIDRL